MTNSKTLSEEFLLIKETIEIIPIGIIIIDEDNKILLYNKKFTEIWDISVDILNQGKSKVLEHMQAKAATSLQHLQYANSNQNNQIRYEVEMKNGTYLEQHTIIEQHEQDNIRKNFKIIYCFYDISPKKQPEQQLENQVMFDPLTELPNKYLLVDRLHQYIAYAQRNNSYIAVLFVGLHSFKDIRDKCGDIVSNQLIKTFGQRLKKNVREQDTVAHLNDDEFVIVITSENFNLESFYKIIQRLFENIMQPYNLDGQEIIAAFNMGISFYPQDGKEPATMITNAGIAMYHVKEKGENTFEVYNEAESFHNFLFTFLL